jgi:hypothetical protein
MNILFVKVVSKYKNFQVREKKYTKMNIKSSFPFLLINTIRYLSVKNRMKSFEP